MIKIFSFLKYKIKLICQNRLVAFLIGIYIGLSLKKISKQISNKKNKVLIFSEKRWIQSLYILKKNKELELFSIPDKIFNQINSLFRAKEYYLNTTSRKRKNEKIIFFRYKSDSYYLNKDSNILEERKRQREFIKIIGNILKKIFSIDCALTCSFYYNQEQEWAAGLTSAKIPFITIHKEQSEFDNFQLDTFLNRLEEIKFKYQGDSILLPNKRMVKVFKKRDMFKNTYINATGIVKYDSLFKRIKKNKKKKIITFFSFWHYLANIDQKENKFDSYSKEKFFLGFSQKKEEGFSRLFYNSHKIFILEALKNKDCIFYIKPRINERWWYDRICDLVQDITGKNIDEIENLFITDESAYNLIRKSVNVIGFNSTVLIESIILGHKPILPLFNEATNKYKNQVFFLKFLNLFSVANSEYKLSKLINLNLKEKIKSKSKSKRNVRQFLEYYINYTKPFSENKTVENIKRIISKYK